MSIQNEYGYRSSRGIPGGMVDMSPRKVVTRSADEAIGFGFGVVAGATPGKSVALPTAATDKFEGVTVNSGTQEMDMDGKVAVKKNGALSVMTFGNVWVRTVKDVEISYNDPVYLIVDGDEAGYFTNAPASTDEGSTDPATIAVNAKFLADVDSSAQIAPVELYGAPVNA